MNSFLYIIHALDIPFGIRRLKLLSGIFITLMLGFSSPKIFAQGFNWLWLTNIWGPYDNTITESLIFDASGNFYIAGNSSSLDGLDPVLEVACIHKFNGAGGLIWSRFIGDLYEFVHSTSISIDDAGNVYTTGTFEGTIDFDPGSDTFELTSAGGTDIYISKLNSSGDFVWAKSIGGPLVDGNFRSCLAINPDNGDLYLTGYFKGTADFDPGSGTFDLTSAGGDDIFISSLDASGNFLWAGRIGGSGTDLAKSITRDNDGDVVSTGKFTGTVDFNPGSSVFNLSGGGTYISKLSGDGGFTFAKKIGNDTGNAIAVDASNNIYTTGPFTGTADFDPGPGDYLLTVNGVANFFISKLDDSGNFVWAKAMGGDGWAEVNGIAVESSGNVFTTGLLVMPSDFDPGPESFIIEGVDFAEVFISKLDSDGNFVSAESSRGEDCYYPDVGNSIAVDNAGSGIITGDWDWDIQIGPYYMFADCWYPGALTLIAKFGTEVAEPLDVLITSSTNILCYSQSTGSATAESFGGYPPYTYDWSNNESGAEINDLAAGTYTVTVTDNNGNTATAQVDITQPPLLELEAPLINNVSCNGHSDGSIQTGASGGVPPYSFSWSNGDSGSSIYNLEIGIYTITITDNNGCTNSASYEVEQPTQLEISLVNLNNESCAGENDGEITISIAGGTNPYTTQWSNGYAEMNISNLEPGGYSVTTTDGNGCEQTADFSVLPGNAVEIDLLLIQHVSCAGGANGEVSVMGTSGVAPYEYLWSNGETIFSIDNLVTGLYSVTTTDFNGCLDTATYLINEPSALTTEITQSSQNLCAGDSTAGLSAMASGGTSPLTAIWSNGVIGFENPNLAAGIYSIIVTDSNGCTFILSDTITDPSSISLNVVSTNETSAGANDGTAISSPTGGVPPFSFLWNNGDTLSALSGLSPGTYTVTTTDANGCTAEGTAIINAFGCALDILLGADFHICMEDTIVLQPTVMGGSGIVSYLWSDGSTGESLSVHQGGSYCVTITDANNCQDLDCIEITEIIIPPLTCPATNESAPGANDGALQCDSLPGVIAYQWSNGATTPSIDSLSPGQYCVTITEQNGCIATQCFYVQPGNCQMAVNDLIITDIKCTGDSTGAIQITINNGNPPITYMWSNGGNTSEIKDLLAGIYSVTIADGIGCVINNSFTISEPLPLSVVIDSIAPAGPSASGLVWISAFGGTPPYTYQWTNSLGDTLNTADLNNLSLSGFYSLKLTDDNSCEFILDSVYVDLEVALDQSPIYNDIKVYPVPAKDVLIIDTDKPVSEVLISGVDGRIYKRMLLPDANKFDIANLGPGWYILRIRMGNTWHVARVVK